MVNPILAPRRLSRLPHRYFYAWKVMPIAQAHANGNIRVTFAHRMAQQRLHYRGARLRVSVDQPIHGFVKQMRTIAPSLHGL